MARSAKVFFGLVLGLLLTVTTVFAQLEMGAISGTVKDASGAVIAGATVKAKSVATGAERTAQTGSLGQYSISSLTPGNYQVTVTSAKFETYRTTTEVTVGGISTVDAQLTVGASSIIVDVVGGMATQVNTETQEVSQLVDTQQMAQLPSLTRDIYDFVAISGNVSNGDSTSNGEGAGQNITARGVGFSMNGQRETGTEILLDGAENVAIFGVTVGENVPLDDVQEYSVITNNFSAEYGRASGGVVNVTTKAGTNSFHGSAWEFNRLSAYTANTYANDAANSAAGSIVDPKGTYTRNMFGWQVGGPIVKNKLFIDESTEWTRVRSAASETAEVFDPSFIAMLPANTQAYFTQYGTGAYPAASGSCSDNLECTTAGALEAAGLTVGPINGITAVPIAQPVLDVVHFTAPFNAGGGPPENMYTLVGRLDYNLSEKTQMFFRTGRDSEDQFAGTSFYSAYPRFDVGYTALNQSFLFSLSHTFNSTLLNDTKISYTRFNDGNSYDTSQTNTPNLMLVSPVDPTNQAFIQTPGLYNTSEPGEGGLPAAGPQNTIQVEHNVSWTKGRHNMRFGGQFTYIQLDYAYGAYAQAVEQLGGTTQASWNDLTNTVGNMKGPGGTYASQLVAFDARLYPQGQLPCVANPGYWLTGSTSDLIQTPACAVTPPLGPTSYGRSYRYKDWALYAQDSFRMSPRLTLNYGLRYEHYGVQHNNNPNLDSNFYFGSGSNFEEQVRNGGVFIADKSPAGGFWKPRWGTFAPRVGFAYDIFGDGKSSLRGGFGISYERNFGNVTFNASFNPPNSAVLSSVCAASVTTCTAVVSTNDLGPLGLPGPPSYVGPTELRWLDPNIEVAQTQFWSLALQRELARNTIVEAGYSGAHGVHLYDMENMNMIGAGQFYLGDPLTFSQSPDCPSPCLNRANDQYSNVNMRGSMGGSSYSSLNLKFQTQNLHNTGLSLVANYTWAHSLDDISSTFSDSLQGGSGYIGSLGYTDPFHPQLDWGSSDYDIRQRIVVSPIWETPWFKSGKGVATQALGGWSVVGIITARTGTPFSAFDYTDDYNLYDVQRLTPVTPITQFHVGSPQNVGVNTFTAMTIPIPASFAPLDPALGISDFGPFPANMTHRNCFRGPGAWNTDMSVGKKFKLTERVGLDFRAEGFNVFNHHNYYVNTSTLAYNGLGPGGALPAPLTVTEEKGGLGTLATGGNNDERRFGQFSLRFVF